MYPWGRKSQKFWRKETHDVLKSYCFNATQRIMCLFCIGSLSNILLLITEKQTSLSVLSNIMF